MLGNVKKKKSVNWVASSGMIVPYFMKKPSNWSKLIRGGHRRHTGNRYQKLVFSYKTEKKGERWNKKLTPYIMYYLPYIKGVTSWCHHFGQSCFTRFLCAKKEALKSMLDEMNFQSWS